MHEMLFAAKKIIGLLLLPAGLIALLWAAGAVLRLTLGRKRLGLALLVAAGGVFVLLSLPVVGQGLLWPLERAAGDYASPQALAGAGVKDIVVLGGGQLPGRRWPAERLAASSLRRTAEAMRLWRTLPGARLIISGAAVDGPTSVAADMAAVAADLGAPPSAIIVDEASKDTAEQAAALAGRLAHRPFALVTSADHMPRALALFRAQGLRPMAAPADFHALGDGPARGLFLPQPQGLLLSQEAMHEYLGLCWAWLHDFWPPAENQP